MTTQRVAEIEQLLRSFQDSARAIHKMLMKSHADVCMVCGVCEDRGTLWEQKIGNYKFNCRHCNNEALHSAYHISSMLVHRGAKTIIPGIGVEKPEPSLDFEVMR
jgi:hypothetical protein